MTYWRQRREPEYTALVSTLCKIRLASTITAAGLLVLVVYLLWPAPCDPDPFGCFGAGRYEAMSQGRVCACSEKN